MNFCRDAGAIQTLYNFVDLISHSVAEGFILKHVDDGLQDLWGRYLRFWQTGNTYSTKAFTLVETVRAEKQEV